MQAAIDSFVLIALINLNDVWHSKAEDLRGALVEANVQLVFFDCVVTESISAATGTS